MAHQRWFTRLANSASRFAGSPYSFVLALLVVLAWILTGPLFGFSDTWQLVINTGTTIVTFLMVFLIQNSQNRDARALQIKLDELIRATRGAHNSLLDLEELEEHELRVFQDRYEALARRARNSPQADDDEEVGTPDIGDRGGRDQPP
ncbi:MAG: low affinity iron permease family protein [Lysobacteraceae bacterium]|nr:MAG: low affinity iron permease family protein [Xanthomonadaceae bacterium]